MKKATIIHHQGYGDLFSNNAICNYYSEIYDELTVFVLDEGRKRVVEAMYKNNPKIRCEIPPFHSIPDGRNGCLICMTNGGRTCPRDGGQCKFIDYSYYTREENIKIGCFNGDYNSWERFLREQYSRGFGFSHCFYLYHNISPLTRIEKFSICLPPALQKTSDTKYIVYHDDPIRGYSILNSNIAGYYPKINLNSNFPDMISAINAIREAKELHFIDSSYSVLIYFLSFIDSQISKIPKFLHAYNRVGRDLLIYNNPTPENWTVV